ncbi:helix-turn-helix transcriptional regulator [Cytophagaceae bacterium DM2B3-1]|uniref:Helix-turn-helix transcriptional regulator n=2 Tax=Xanthocytophaga flava TaxID=3048013 RepID=A0ABT7CEU1_9BACT|nr:helix-turn-helix transcriptional regulator [Xanthocytophaga flavus]MDJ1472244.1 helix-turn-helix transcriptional regulator [Xanthocytophaga flavus]MDJ1492255.1 helix-turn-helix transcriptional regulator [Xanthocytophaga flavus]
MVVQQVLQEEGLHPIDIRLGEVQIQEELAVDQAQSLREKLEEVGFELLDDKKQKMIERIKTVIITLIHSENDNLQKVNHSDYIAEQLNRDYGYLSSLFSEVEGITIEKYIINQKIEKVKELLMYDELSLSEIADQLHYSSVQHLSNQFKKVTGLTPSYFKHLKEKKRKSLDQI